MEEGFHVGIERGLACRNRRWTWGFVAILLCIYIRGIMIRNVIGLSNVVVRSEYALGHGAFPDAAFRTLFVETTTPDLGVHISLSVD